MTPTRYKALENALRNAADEYRNAAEEEMRVGQSVHNVYQLVKESYSIEGRARNLSRRYGVDPCNCR